MACMNLSLWFEFCKSLSGFQFPLQSWLYSQAPAMTTASSPTTTQEVNVASEACRRKMFSVPFTSFKFGGKCRLWKKTCQSRFSLDMNHVTTFVTLCVNCPMTGKLLKNPVILNWWSGSGFLDLWSVNPVGARESVLGGPKNKVCTFHLNHLNLFLSVCFKFAPSIYYLHHACQFQGWQVGIFGAKFQKFGLIQSGLSWENAVWHVRYSLACF